MFLDHNEIKLEINNKKSKWKIPQTFNHQARGSLKRQRKNPQWKLFSLRNEAKIN